MARVLARTVGLVAAALVATVVLAACGGERERLSQELADRLAAAGVEASDVSVWPPHGMVPHTNVDLRVTGDEASAQAACETVEELAVYDGERPYLVRVTYGSGQVFECGWGKNPPHPSGVSPAATMPEGTATASPSG
jgi:hypothetical protein